MILSLFLLISCSSNEKSNHDDTGSGTIPAPPLVEDSSYEATLGREWNLVGDDVTDGHDSLVVEVAGDTDELLVWLDGVEQPSFETTSTTLDISSLDAGEHTVLLSADGGVTAFAELEFYRTHPLYVMVSVDWDRADPADMELDWQLGLHDAYPDLRLTQFVGPYSFTEPEVSAERSTELVDWLRENEAAFGDETGLHVHAYCSFVEAAGVDCLTEPSFAYEAGDETGYTVMLSAYSQEEMSDMFAMADVLFEENGLDKATSFRAGGWIADADVLMALAENDYVVDTSAVNWRLIEEWAEHAENYEEINGVLYTWNAKQWASIDETSQPYQPSVADVSVAGEPAIDILEVPDNACLGDYVSDDEMIAIFEANWPGGALFEPTNYSMGYHNSTSISIRQNISSALDHITTFLAEDDAGPVVFATLSETALIWPIHQAR